MNTQIHKYTLFPSLLDAVQGTFKITLIVINKWLETVVDFNLLPHPKEGLEVAFLKYTSRGYFTSFHVMELIQKTIS